MGRKTSQHRELARERLLLFGAILLSLVFLIESPQNLNSITGAQTAIESFTNINYSLVAVLILLSLLFAVYVVILLRQRKPRPWHQGLRHDDDPPLETWEAGPRLLDDKIDRINKELWKLTKDMPHSSRKMTQTKRAKIPNPSENKTKKELKVDKKMQGSARPLVLKVPKQRKQLEQDLQVIKDQLENLEAMNITKVKIREELPSSLALSGLAESRKALDDERRAQRQTSSEVNRYLSDSTEFSDSARTKRMRSGKAHTSRSLRNLQQDELEEIEKKLLQLG